MSEKGAGRAGWRVILGVYLALTALVVAWPNAWTVNRTVVRVWQIGVTNGWYDPSTFSPEAFATLLNVILFIPLVVLAAASFPRVPVWVWVLVAFVGSCLIEGGQLLGGVRDATYLDVISNTGGALIGALLVVVGRHLRHVG